MVLGVAESLDQPIVACICNAMNRNDIREDASRRKKRWEVILRLVESRVVLEFSLSMEEDLADVKIELCEGSQEKMSRQLYVKFEAHPDLL